MGNKAVFDRSILAAATELFESQGIELRAVAQTESSMEIAATISFSADELRGTAGIGLSPSTLERLLTSAFDDRPPSDPLDWLGEALNQLLGRLKNKLLGYGVAISPALPTVLRGIRLELRPAGLSSLWTYGFEMPAGSFCVWVDVHMLEGLTLAPRGGPEFQAVREGELLLF